MYLVNIWECGRPISCILSDCHDEQHELFAEQAGIVELYKSYLIEFKQTSFDAEPICSGTKIATM